MKAFAYFVAGLGFLTGVFLAADAVFHIGDRLFGNWPPLPIDPAPTIDPTMLILGLVIALPSAAFLVLLIRSRGGALELHLDLPIRRDHPQHQLHRHE